MKINIIILCRLVKNQTIKIVRSKAHLFKKKKKNTIFVEATTRDKRAKKDFFTRLNRFFEIYKRI